MNKNEYLKEKNKKYIRIRFKENEPLLDNVENKNLFRLMFCATFCGKENYLYWDTKSGINGKRNVDTYNPSNKKLDKNDLKYLLGLDFRRFNKFWKEMIDKEIFIIDDGIKLSEKYFKFGKIKSDNFYKKWDGKYYCRLYKKPTRMIYDEFCDKSLLVGFIYKLIPYTHRKYGFICGNVAAEYVKDIEEMKSRDLAEINGTNNSNFRKRYLNPLFEFVIDGEHLIKEVELAGKKIIMVNPQIFYRGSEEKKAQKIFNKNNNL